MNYGIGWNTKEQLKQRNLYLDLKNKTKQNEMKSSCIWSDSIHMNYLHIYVTVDQNHTKFNLEAAHKREWYWSQNQGTWHLSAMYNP